MLLPNRFNLSNNLLLLLHEKISMRKYQSHKRNTYRSSSNNLMTMPAIFGFFINLYQLPSDLSFLWLTVIIMYDPNEEKQMKTWNAMYGIEKNDVNLSIRWKFTLILKSLSHKKGKIDFQINSRILFDQYDVVFSFIRKYLFL